MFVKKFPSWLVYPINILRFICWLIIYGIDSLILIAAVAIKPGIQQDKLLILFVIYTLISLAGLIFSYHKQLTKIKYWNSKPFNFKQFWTIIIFGIIIMGIQIGWELLIQHQFLNTPNNQQIIDQQYRLSPFWNQLDSIVIAPIFEELIFRGLFFNYFIHNFTRLNQIIGLIVSSLLFGYAHELSFDPTMLLYSLGGLVLGCCYLHFRDIRYSIGIHIFNNLFAIL